MMAVKGEHPGGRRFLSPETMTGYNGTSHYEGKLERERECGFSLIKTVIIYC